MSVSGKCVNFEYSIWRTDILIDEGLEILRKIIRQWNEKEKGDNASVCFAICPGCIGTRMAKFMWQD